jgi:hypothetical protein
MWIFSRAFWNNSGGAAEVFLETGSTEEEVLCLCLRFFDGDKLEGGVECFLLELDIASSRRRLQSLEMRRKNFFDDLQSLLKFDRFPSITIAGSKMPNIEFRS